MPNEFIEVNTRDGVCLINRNSIACVKIKSSVEIQLTNGNVIFPIETYKEVKDLLEQI